MTVRVILFLGNLEPMINTYDREARVQNFFHEDYSLYNIYILDLLNSRAKSKWDVLVLPAALKMHQVLFDTVDVGELIDC